MMRSVAIRLALAACIAMAVENAEAQEGASSKPPGVPLVPGVFIERNVKYGQVDAGQASAGQGGAGQASAGARALVLDVLRPADPASSELPVVVFIHGGGWRQGDKSGGSRMLEPLVATGNYVGISVGYRLSKEATFPAQIHDCKGAIRWIRANAQRLGADSRKIGVWGSSAGGHLASLVGTSGDVKSLEGDCGNPEMSSRVACVVDFCGPSDFLALIKFQRNGPPAPRNADSPESQLLGGRIADRQELAMDASPVTYATRDDPPFLIVHGTADPLVPFNQAERLYASLATVGARPTMLRIERGGHSIGGEEVLARVQAFFDRHLRDQRVNITDATIAAPKSSSPKQGSPGQPQK